MPIVIGAQARERASIGKLEMALLALQGLDGWLFVNSEKERVLRRINIKIKPHDLGRLRRKVHLRQPKKVHDQALGPVRVVCQCAKIGKEWGCESPHDEGVANHIDPESCAGAREGLGKA